MMERKENLEDGKKRNGGKEGRVSLKVKINMAVVDRGRGSKQQQQQQRLHDDHSRQKPGVYK